MTAIKSVLINSSFTIVRRSMKTYWW